MWWGWGWRTGGVLARRGAEAMRAEIGVGHANWDVADCDARDVRAGKERQEGEDGKENGGVWVGGRGGSCSAARLFWAARLFHRDA